MSMYETRPTRSGGLKILILNPAKERKNNE